MGPAATASRGRRRPPIRRADGARPIREPPRPAPPIGELPRPFVLLPSRGASGSWSRTAVPGGEEPSRFPPLAPVTRRTTSPRGPSGARVKWPVEVAQDDSWRMESGTGSGFLWHWGGWSRSGWTPPRGGGAGRRQRTRGAPGPVSRGWGALICGAGGRDSWQPSVPSLACLAALAPLPRLPCPKEGKERCSDHF